MGDNKYPNSFLIILSVIFIFFSKETETAEEDVDNLLSLFDRPLESVTPIIPPPVLAFPPQPFPGDESPPLVGGGPISNESRPFSVASSVPIIPIEPVTLIDDDFKSIDKREEFSVFIPRHLNIAAKLTKIFLDFEDNKGLFDYARGIRNQLNPYLFTYAFSVALMHRPSTHNESIPSQIQSFPYKYFDKEVFLPAREQLVKVSVFDRKPIELERTASDFEDEHRLSYWREDIALNLHHWHWHLAYPNMGDERVLVKDRRGELFYYMHQQILARYNFERLSNDLKIVERLSNWNSPIKEAYFPKLDNVAAKTIYPSRPKNMIMDDIRIAKEDIEVDVGDMIRYRDRIFRAIDLGYAEGANGEKVYLDEVTGINTLGNILESSELSPNPRYYGNLHGSGHIMIAYIHDPKHHHLQSIAVMGDTATAMRDPVFYRWHAYIDDIFQQYKKTLPPYTRDELIFPGVDVTSVKVISDGETSDNVFHTHWNKTDVNLANGLDFSPESGEVFVRYRHLDHRSFDYQITVDNSDNKAKVGICRIFLAPAIDEARKPWTRFVDQKNMFIEMDKFKVTLKPGINNIIRKSSESTLTIPLEETFYDFRKKGRKLTNPHVYSGCGWPHHMLVPKGSEHGFPGEVFVIISDVAKDKVKGTRNTYNEGLCGVRNNKFPHKRAMGFPFDRLPRKDVRTLRQFLTHNMYIQKCKIIHTNS